MKTFLAFIQKRNMLFKIILSYSLVGFLFVSGFSYVILLRVSSELKGQVNDASNRMIEQSYNTAEILLSSAYNYYSQLFIKNEWINTALYGQNFTQEDIYKIDDQLNDFKQTNPLVESIYVYNYNKRVVFSSALTFSSTVDFFDKGMTDLLEQKDMNRQGIFIPRKASIIYPNSSNIGESKDFITLVYSSLRPDGNRDSMVVNLDQKVLQDLVMKGNGNENYKMMIFNDQGKVVSRPADELFDGRENPQKIMDTTMENKDKKGNFLIKLNNHSYMASYVKADRLGWNFIILSDYNKMLGTVNSFRSFLLKITLLCLVIIAVTSAFFTRIIYVPIYRIIKRTLSVTDTKDKPEMNEYDLLNKSFSLLENKVCTLQTDINQSASARNQSILRSILQGTYGKGNIQQALRKLDLGVESDRFVVCILKIDSFHEISEKYDMVDLSLLKYAIENISREITSSSCKLEVLEDGHDSLDLVFNIGEEIDDIELINPIIRDIQSKVALFLKMTVTASIGPIAKNAYELHHSRMGAYQAVHFRLIQGTNSMIWYDEIIKQETKDYQYPVTLEKQMMNSLKAGELEQLQELSAEFFATVYPFKHDEITLSVVQLLVMTIRTAKGMSSFDHEDADMEIHTCQQQLLRLDTLEQMEKWYLSICARIVEARDKDSQSKNAKTVEKMVEYIKTHYTDTNLSADMLAQLIGLSSSYVRKLIKDETGKSVAEHIAEHRFKKARELLISTDYPAKKVGEMVGFENTSYFYVLFKKHVGMSPDHFRRENKLENMMTD